MPNHNAALTHLVDRCAHKSISHSSKSCEATDESRCWHVPAINEFSSFKSKSRGRGRAKSGKILRTGVLMCCGGSVVQELMHKQAIDCKGQLQPTAEVQEVSAAIAGHVKCTTLQVHAAWCQTGQHRVIHSQMLACSLLGLVLDCWE